MVPARAAYPKGNLSIKMCDAIGTIYQDQAFADQFPQKWATGSGSMATGADYCDAVY